MTGMADLRLPTCAICGFRVTVPWARHLAWVALHGIPTGHRFAGLVTHCPECSTGRHVVLVPFWFTTEWLGPISEWAP